MPSPCCKRKYSKPNKCRCPSNNCKCFVQSVQCPPTSEDEEGPVLYAPVIAAAPSPKKCCCSKCCCTKCEIKQKKSLWQQLFGDRKCCSPCQKKKQECLCKQKKKPRCVSECLNKICCTGYKQPPPPPPPPPKPCKPLCCCKVKPYKCKPCCPTTPDSLFGCHFYCNVENRGNRSKQPRCQCCCCCTCSSDNRKPPSETTDDEKETNNLMYTNNKERLIQAPPPPKKIKINEDSLEQSTRQGVEPTRSNIHIGLTITNTDTKYYKKNTVICPPVEEDPCYNNNENEISSGSSEHIITLEIHQSDEKVDQDKKENQSRNQSRDEENASVSSSRRRELSTVREENESHIKSESYAREIKPLLERKRNSKDSFVENRNSLRTSGKKENRIGSKRHDVDRSVDTDLDKRVSEILRRLRTIESKINMIDRNKPEDKNFKVDIDKNKSTVSFHFKDGKFYDSYDNNDYRTTHDKNSRKADAVIEIRQTRSKSCSPVRKYSSTQINRKHRYSRSLDRGVRAQRENPKLVIKVPHGNKISQGAVTVYNNKRIKSSSRDYRDTEWMEISNELKSRNPAHSRCYCYECVCQRARCK